MGMNSKAVEARERKAAVKKATQEKAAREAEDRVWHDDDKSVARKQQKREEDERKKAEAARRKAEAKALLDQEMSSIKTQGKQPLAKINRQQILEEMEKKQKAIDAINAASKPLPSRVVVQHDQIEENLNRALADVEVATGIEQAIAVLRLVFFLLSCMQFANKLILKTDYLYYSALKRTKRINTLKNVCVLHIKRLSLPICHVLKLRILLCVCLNGNKSS